jgi:hypothetical protein
MYHLSIRTQVHENCAWAALLFSLLVGVVQLLRYNTAKQSFQLTEILW